MVIYSYDRRAVHKGQLQTWLEKSPAADDGSKEYKKMVNLAKDLDNKVRTLNPEDRYTLIDRYDDFKDLAKKYVGTKPKTYDHLL